MSTLIIIGIFIVGMFAGKLIPAVQRYKLATDKLVTWSIWLLLFLMGISVGINEQVIQNFAKIGWVAILVTVGAVAGSILVTAAVGRFLIRDKKESETKSAH